MAVSRGGRARHRVLPVPSRARVNVAACSTGSPSAGCPPVQSLHPPTNTPGILIILLSSINFKTSDTFNKPYRAPAFRGLTTRKLGCAHFRAATLYTPAHRTLLAKHGRRSINVNGVARATATTPKRYSIQPGAGTPLTLALGLGNCSATVLNGYRRIPI